MIYIGIAIVLALIALLIALASLRLLIGDWIIAWLRGSAGLLLIGIAILIGFAAWDLHTYRQISDMRPIATLAFNKIDDKQFGVNLIDQSGNEQGYQISGDFWQIDIHVLKWFDGVDRLGVKPGYRLDRLTGRYLSLADEQKLPHTEIELNSQEPLFDVWARLRAANRYFSILEAQEANANYLPMGDGALYSVSVGANGLNVQPLNERAKLAMDQWQ